MHRLGFSGIRRTARCAGSLTCPSSTCPYEQQFKKKNRLQFERCGAVDRCFTCSSKVVTSPCDATKVYEFDSSTKTAVILHNGTHTCEAKRLLKQFSIDAIKEAVKKHPRINVNRIVNMEMVSLFREKDFKWSDITEMADNCANMKRVQNLKSSAQRELHPVGENFEALGVFKARCDEIDRFLIYKMNNRSNNNEPSYVLKSSRSMVQMMCDMDRTKDQSLSAEYAFVDVTHTRCNKFKTLTMWVFNPVMRRLMRLAIMEIEQENTANLTIFFTLINEMIQKHTGDNTYVFNPRGFSVDEHNANWNSLAAVYGQDVLSRTVSCEFHYAESVSRHAKTVGRAGAEFKRLADDMLHAVTPQQYNVAKGHMEIFVATHDSLQNWLIWWDRRCTHVMRAFKPSDAPGANLSEVGHAKLATSGRDFMTLLEAANEDCAQAFRQDSQYRQFAQGVPVGGKGAGLADKQRRVYRREMERAETYGSEVCRFSFYHFHFSKLL
jgi:hypothetical protein